MDRDKEWYKREAISFLHFLEPSSTFKDNIRKARQECHKKGWNQITLEKVEFGISLFHHKPSMLNDYINEIRKQNE